MQNMPYGYEPANSIPYATFGERAVAYLWDIFYAWPGFVVVFFGYIVLFVGIAASSETSTSPLTLLGFLLILVGFGVMLWRWVKNYMLDQGRTGYTYGKRKVGIRTVAEGTGQEPGVASCVARYFLHWIFNSVCYIDFLWPLWDPKKQTLTDKVLTTVVINQPVSTDPSGYSPQGYGSQDYGQGYGDQQYGGGGQPYPPPPPSS